jgi:hypothetical protein
MVMLPTTRVFEFTTTTTTTPFPSSNCLALEYMGNIQLVYYVFPSSTCQIRVAKH